MTENKRFIIDDAGTLIDIQTRNTYDYVSDVCPLLNELNDENEQLKKQRYDLYMDIARLVEENEQLKQQIKKLESQLYCPYDSICINCVNEYLVQKDKYYVSKCKKGHEQCSRTDVKYCDDFELKGDVRMTYDCKYHIGVICTKYGSNVLWCSNCLFYEKGDVE